MMRRLLPVIAAVSFLALEGCGYEQSAYKEVRSPDGRYVAIERETNCGATDPFGTAISVQSVQPRLGMAWLGYPAKRVFLADVSMRDTRVIWRDNRNLDITCTGCEKYGVAERVNAWKDVNVKFDVGKAGEGVF
jgi:hypothetical protein